MKHFLTRFSSILLIFLLLAGSYTKPAFAEPANNYSHLFISISDAITNSKQGNDEKAKEAIATFKKDWEASNRKDSKAATEVNNALAAA
ncbi:MAG: hypothetical protein KC452_10175, partial [Kurthia sp.]|nr:hypothetical protein [Kurthia sp.]